MKGPNTARKRMSIIKTSKIIHENFGIQKETLTPESLNLLFTSLP